MTPIVRDVCDMSENERRALECILGCALRDDQQVVLGVQASDNATNETSGSSALVVPDWWNVYEGLTEAEVDILDAAIRQRANSTRTFEG